MFRNVIAYKLTKNFDFNAITLKALEECAFTPCGAHDLSKFGWDNTPNDTLMYSDPRYTYLVAKNETKLLPNEVVKEEVANRIEEFEEKEGRKLKKTEKQSIKDDVISSLLPRAFSKYSLTELIIDRQEGIIFINASSAKKAETVLSLLRKSLGSLPVFPIMFNKTLTEVLGEAILTNKLPDLEFEVGSAIEYTDGERAVVCKNAQIDLLPEELGFTDKEQVCKVELLSDEWEGAKFSLNETSVVSKLKVGLESEMQETPFAKFQSDFAIFAPLYTQLFAKIGKMLGGVKEIKE